MTLPAGSPEPTIPTAPSRRRPGTVAAAAVLMFVLSLLSLGWGGLALLAVALIGDQALRAEFERQSPEVPDEQIEPMLAAAKALAYGSGALLVVLGLVAAILGFLVYRGSRVARILTWVFTSFFALCGLCVGVTGLLTASGVEAVIGSALPAVTLLVAITIIVLLAMPASHPYFAKPEPGMTPYVGPSTVPTSPVSGSQPDAAPTPSGPPVPPARSDADRGDDEPPQSGSGEPPAAPCAPPPPPPRAADART